MSLPTRVASLRQFVDRWPQGPSTIRARVTKSGFGQAIVDIDIVGEDGGLLARLEGCECAVDASLAEAFRRNAVAA